jgi:acyl-CoA thioester hydrolase
VLPIQVNASDIDELGHANNLTYIRWVLLAAVEHSLAAGLSMQDYRERGQAFVVRRHEVDYLRPAFLGDRLLVETRVIAMRAVSSQRQTLIRRKDGGELLVRGLTGWAYIDLRSGRPVRIPKDIKDRFCIDPPGERPGDPAPRG